MAERESGQSRGWKKIGADLLPLRGEPLEIGFFSVALGILVLPGVYKEIKRLVLNGNIRLKKSKVNSKESG